MALGVATGGGKSIAWCLGDGIQYLGNRVLVACCVF